MHTVQGRPQSCPRVGWGSSGSRTRGDRSPRGEGGPGQLPAEKTRCPGGSRQAGEAKQTRRHLLTKAMVEQPICQLGMPVPFKNGWEVDGGSQRAGSKGTGKKAVAGEKAPGPTVRQGLRQRRRSRTLEAVAHQAWGTRWEGSRLC